MKNLNLLIKLVITSIVLISCSLDDVQNSISCNQDVIISLDEYTNAPNDYLVINNIELNANCLKINFSSSGCSGSSWEVKLIDAENLLYSNPPQRNLRLSLKNEELCEAYITKEITFDISSLQVDGNQVFLNITNTNQQILYKY